MGIGVSPDIWNRRWAGCGLLGVLTLIFFGDLLFGFGDAVVSQMGTDIWRQFAGWRFFGFDQIRQGNFPFWTPLVYGGMPYFSGFQSALFYPPNWIYLILPLDKAINWGVALHVWWLGAGMFLWMRSAGLRQPAALFSGALMMFCAPHFLHIYAGHLTNLCVMAWMPWHFMAIGRWREDRKVHWVLLGAMAVALEIFAGHPQYVYYGAIAASLYAGLQLFTGDPGRWRFVIGFAAMYLLAALLTAVQLLPGFEATGESIRSGGTGKDFAGSYSFPPENLVTFLVPGFFGDRVNAPYWGRWFYWEMAAFFSVAGLWCAVIAGIWEKRSRLTLIAAVVCLLLALGSYTPLFHVMYALVPGYDLFRGNSKFMFFAVLFGSALAGMGFDRLCAKEKLGREKVLIACGGAGVLILVVAALWAGASAGPDAGSWAGMRRWIWETRQVTHLPEETYFAADFAATAAKNTSRGLSIAGGVLFLVAGCTALRHRMRFAVYGIIAVGMIEAVVFAANFRKSFKFSHLLPSYQVEFRAKHEGDYRAIDLAMVNGGMLSGIPDIWGDDPGVLRRYSEFMAVTQGEPPDAAHQNMQVRKSHKAWDFLRCEYAFAPTQEGVRDQILSMRPLKRFELVPGYQVVTGRDAILQVLFSDSFDPRKTVLLEEAPGVSMNSGGDAVQGSWLIEREDTDEVVVRVSADRPCILLMTDPFSKGWRVEGVSKDSPQREYSIQPANYMLRGIPLEKGEHHLRFRYLPRTFKASAAISVGAALLWGAGLAWSLRSRGEGGPGNGWEKSEREPKAKKGGRKRRK